MGRVRGGAAAAVLAVLVLAGCASTVSGHGALRAGAGGSGPSGFPSQSGASGSATSTGGNASLSADQLSAAAAKALTTVTALRIAGSGSDGSDQLQFDMHYGVSSSSGSLTVEGAPVQLRYVGGQYYMNAPPAFWRNIEGQDGSLAARNAAVALLANKWAHIPPGTEGLSDIANFADRQNFIAQIAAGGSDDDTTYHLGAPTSVDGHAVLSVVADDDGSTLYVPASGTIYPVRVVDKGDDGGTFDITDWNVPYSAPAPPAGQVIELPH